MLNNRFLRAALIIGLFIIISSSFMSQLMKFFIKVFGELAFAILIGIIFFIALFYFAVFIVKSKLNLYRTLLIILLLAGGIFLAWQLEIPQERIHILEYGILGWFASRGLITHTKKEGIIFSWILIIVIGILDELFQKVLPYRVGDIRDIMFNSLGGLWGIALCWIQNR